MHAGRDDFMRVLSASGIYHEVKTFEGAPHAFCLFQPWFDSTVQHMNAFLRRLDTLHQGDKTIIVAQDGSGDFKTIQEAVNAIPDGNKQQHTIFLKEGIYTEKLLIDSTKGPLSLIGEDAFRTVVRYNDHAGKISHSGDTINTITSWSVRIRANDFRASDISFVNDAGFSAGQAVAVESAGDKGVFRNCRFTGFQDVLFLSREHTRHYFENCYIAGTTDFIFGSATAWFENCHIHSLKNSHVTAAATPQNESGFVFNNCILTGDSSLHNVSLGRPWRRFAHVVYMNSYIGSHIKSEGWSNWNSTDHFLTTRYEEYKNYGPSSGYGKRVPWSRQLTEAEAKKYSIENIFGGWNPKTAAR